MTMDFLRRISPEYIPPVIQEQGGLAVIRERILQSVLLICTGLGLLAVIVATVNNLNGGSLALIIVYFSVYLIILVVTAFRNIPYIVRGNVLVLLLYFMAVTELFESGQLGEVRMFLLVFMALTSVFFNYKSVIAALIISLATIASAGIYASSTTTPFIPALVNLNQGTDWVTSSSMFLVLSLALSGSITMIISGLDAHVGNQEALAKSLEKERGALEERVRNRTSNLERRVAQLHAASQVSRTISELNDPARMLSRVVDLVKEYFKLYYVGIFLLDETHENAILRAGTGEAGRQMLLNKHHLSVGGGSMIGWAIANRSARIALDVGDEAVRFNNPYLPQTRSELALPIAFHNEILGAMTVQSANVRAFDEDDIAILQSVADSLAIALENDRLFNETRKSLDEIRSLNRAYVQQSWAETLGTYGDLSYAYENPQAPAGMGTPGQVQVPIMLRNEVLGTISLEMDRPELSSEEAAFIDNLTTQTAIALENARLLNETEQRATQEQKLNELTSRFSRAINIDEVLNAAIQQLGELPAVAQVSVRLRPADTGPLSGIPGRPASKERAS